MKMLKWIIPFFTSFLLFSSFPGYTADRSESADNAASGVVQQVNINSADAETLASVLTGIGIKRAKALVEYRITHGPFQSVDELQNVKGIGMSIIQKNRDKIRL